MDELLTRQGSRSATGLERQIPMLALPFPRQRAPATIGASKILLP
jgi:hypothetical protein